MAASWLARSESESSTVRTRRRGLFCRAAAPGFAAVELLRPHMLHAASSGFLPVLGQAPSSLLAGVIV